MMVLYEKNDTMMVLCVVVGLYDVMIVLWCCDRVMCYARVVVML